MAPRPTRTTVDALRQTLTQVEEQAGLAPDDVCLIELKRILLNRIVELEAAEFAANSTKDRPPILAALELATLSEDERAAAVAVDLAVSLLTDQLPSRPSEARVLAPPASKESTAKVPSKCK